MKGHLHFRKSIGHLVPSVVNHLVQILEGVNLKSLDILVDVRYERLCRRVTSL